MATSSSKQPFSKVTYSKINSKQDLNNLKVKIDMKYI
jgi:hypothetical protein